MMFCQIPEREKCCFLRFFVIGRQSLQKALVAVPDLRSAEMTLGLSVDLKWSTGINFNEVIKTHKEYLMADNIHLTPNGNIALGKYISESVK